VVLLPRATNSRSSAAAARIPGMPGAERGRRVRRAFLPECVLPGVERLGAAFAARRESPWKPVVDAARLLCAADSAMLEEGKPC